VKSNRSHKMEEKQTQGAFSEEAGLREIFINEFSRLRREINTDFEHLFRYQRDTDIRFAVLESKISEMEVTSSSQLNVDSKVPDNDLDISQVYEENEDEVNITFRNNEELVNASRLGAPNVSSRERKSTQQDASKDKEEKKADRRDSVYRKLDRVNSGVSDRIQVYRNTPSFAHCKLLKFDVGAVMNFAKEIDQFQSKHHLAVPAATLVTKDIKYKLLGICEIPKLNAANFYALDSKPLIQLLQKALRPTNVHDFRRQLNKNLNFSLPKEYKPTVTNFFILHQQLLSFRVEFQQLYDFLADGNELLNIPKCDNKDGGLIKIFIESSLMV